MPTDVAEGVGSGSVLGRHTDAKVKLRGRRLQEGSLGPRREEEQRAPPGGPGLGVQGQLRAAPALGQL